MEPYGVWVYTDAYGGLRFGEAAALRRGRCDLLRKRLQIVESLGEPDGKVMFGDTKTHRRREVALPEFVAEMLAAHLCERVPPEPHALVFTSPEGTALRHSNFLRRVWNPAVQSVGLDHVTPHALRHTCGALWVAAGEHLMVVQRQLGHSSITITERVYGHLLPNALDEAAARIDSAYRSSATSARYPRGTTDGSSIVPMPSNERRNTA